jgi:UDP-N-acetyl-D-galactosamine dehydrogenase
VNVTVHDPRASEAEVFEEYGITMTGSLPKGKVFDAIILAVAHQEFLELDFAGFGRTNAVLFDVKSALPKSWNALRL